jgi:nucleoside-diphosphate-sugar epimerase
MTAGGAKISREDALLPLFFDSPYQISKILGELYLNYYFSRYGFPAVKTRFQNVYGPGEILGAGAWRGTTATVWRNVTPTFVYRAMKGLPLRVDSEEASRDFIYVTDIVDGLVRAAVHGRAGEAYNLGTGVETRIAELARTICARTGSKSVLEVGSQRPWDHSVRRAAATDKSERELGFKTSVDIDAGLTRTVEWTRANLSRIDEAIARHRSFMEAAERSAP